MTRENIMAGLETYRATVARIGELEKEIDKWKSVAMSLGNSIGSGMPGSHNSGNARYTRAIEELTDIQNKYLDEIIILNSSLETTRRYIDLETVPHRNLVLKMRYIDGLSMAKIAAKIDRSANTVYKIHNTAIKDLVRATKKAPE